MHQNPQNKYPITAPADVSCTILILGCVGHISDCLADSKAVARQDQTPIFAKTGTRKTACQDLPSGPLWGTGNHVVESDLAQPAPYTLGTSWYTRPSEHASHAFRFAHGLRMIYMTHALIRRANHVQAQSVSVNHEQTTSKLCI